MAALVIRRDLSPQWKTSVREMAGRNQFPCIGRCWISVVKNSCIDRLPCFLVTSFYTFVYVDRERLVLWKRRPDALNPFQPFTLVARSPRLCTKATRPQPTVTSGRLIIWSAAALMSNADPNGDTTRVAALSIHRINRAEKISRLWKLHRWMRESFALSIAPLA